MNQIEDFDQEPFTAVLAGGGAGLLVVTALGTLLVQPVGWSGWLGVWALGYAMGATVFALGALLVGLPLWCWYAGREVSGGERLLPMGGAALVLGGGVGLVVDLTRGYGPVATLVGLFAAAGCVFGVLLTYRVLAKSVIVRLSLLAVLLLVMIFSYIVTADLHYS